MLKGGKAKPLPTSKHPLDCENKVRSGVTNTKGDGGDVFSLTLEKSIGPCEGGAVTKAQKSYEKGRSKRRTGGKWNY